MSGASSLPLRIRDAVAAVDPCDMAARLMLVYLLLKPAFPWYGHVPVVALAICGLLFPALARDPRVWLVLTVMTSTKLIANASFVDNHFFVVTYACLALACCLATDEPARALATSGKALVAAIFCFALLWKLVLTGDWLSGALFRDLLLTDPRFADLARSLGGVDGATWQHNSAVLSAVLLGQDGAASGVLREPASLTRLALLSTAWTTVIELAVALSFLWPRSRRPSGLRHAALLLFCWTGYAFGTVTGFGWMLVILGLAQCERERRWTRVLYLATFFLILAYARIPWSDLLVRLSGG